MNATNTTELMNTLGSQAKAASALMAKAGAATNLASQHVAAAFPDGHVLCVCVTNVATNQFLYGKPGYNAEQDFAPVGLIARFPMILVVLWSVIRRSPRTVRKERSSSAAGRAGS